MENNNKDRDDIIEEQDLDDINDDNIDTECNITDDIKRVSIYNNNNNNDNNDDNNKKTLLERVNNGEFMKIAAPMVRFSRLPFRLLCKKWGCDITYSPMILAEAFNRSAYARDSDFSTNIFDDSLIVQFAANSAEELAAAAEKVAKHCQGVDINCGCPQKWVMKEGYGANLLQHPQKITDMVKQVNNRVGIPCSIKIRVDKNLQKTVELVRQAEASGVSWLAVHGRTSSQRSSHPVDYEAIKLVKESVSIPVFANGDIFTLEQANEFRMMMNKACFTFFMNALLWKLRSSLFDARSSSLAPRCPSCSTVFFTIEIVSSRFFCRLSIGSASCGFCQLQPVPIYQENASEERGEVARLSSFVGAIALTDLVKTTLGPKGMDKILASMSNPNEITVTNDGATILTKIYIDNPAAKILVDISRTQDDEVGDGTTSVCVLAGELLREGERLVAQKVHPQTIINGWRLALDTARSTLVASAIDHSSDKAKTTLSSKILHTEKEHFATIVVDAILRLKGNNNLENIHIIKKSGGSLRDSYLEDGFILEKRIGVGCPKRMENAKILIANTAMDTDKIKIFGGKVVVESMNELSKLEDAEKTKMLEKCKKIVDHGINCFINRQLIYNLPEQYFAEHGVLSIEHADFEGVERLALVTGAEIVSTFDHPELVKIGTCKLIEEVIIGEDKVIKFSGLPDSQACTIVLRGATSHMLEEAERSIHDALCVLSVTVGETRTVLGGGCVEMEMAQAVDKLAANTPGKKALAIESFAKALRQIPTIIANNAGYDSSELVAQLKAAHYQGKSQMGLNMKEGCIGNIVDLGIIESFKVKQQVLVSAHEAAEMIMRVDDILRAAPRKREPMGRH
ncbi:chaperonin containing TCP1 beta subunit [Heterostelium album PN500]|uniref:CCT-beta n=1 Tax=Heterostelium pallidum (strain ATCC 26659 / Pp 5 / PN500) TaxID=670386 RepID=D3B5E4_HETP5|nr:chaperonin containing TCP1 beta subunit [Heterostelium album PN500]EFA83092.1 chaperonin containing TCP1 beta subunit [Heterostelium album PN500]|eukprot:XP_020435209.1 chaperonin containing TCP1 beta subunit [Heterostelium album PN500]